MIGFGIDFPDCSCCFWEEPRGAWALSPAVRGLSSGEEFCARRAGAWRRRGGRRGAVVRGAHGLGALALGTVGLGGEAPRGSKSESIFVGF